MLAHWVFMTIEEMEELPFLNGSKYPRESPLAAAGQRPIARSAFASRAGCSRVKRGWTFGDPLDEAGKPRVRAQGLDRVIVPGQFCLGESGVNFVVTDLVQSYDRPPLAAFEPGDEMVQALGRFERNRAAT